LLPYKKEEHELSDFFKRSFGEKKIWLKVSAEINLYLCTEKAINF
jgi:hypothetical protein